VILSLLWEGERNCSTKQTFFSKNAGEELGERRGTLFGGASDWGFSCRCALHGSPMRRQLFLSCNAILNA